MLRLHQLDFINRTNTGLAFRIAQNRVSASQILNF